MKVLKFTADGVGDRSYMIVDQARGAAAVIDAQRDVWTYLDEAQRLGVHISHALDTHVHNDFVSGSHALQELAGAIIVQAAEVKFDYPVRGIRDGETLNIADGFSIRALHTPGHTFHHMSYAVEEDGKTAALFTGGSLLVDTIGRTDLVSPGATEQLARAQRASLLRLFEFSDDTEVFPTHGAGSFCAAGSVPDRETTSIGREKRDNRAAHVAMHEDEDAFVRFALHGLTQYPAYYAHMAPVNLAGGAPLARLPVLEGIDPRKVYELQRQGTSLVDARRSIEFAHGFPRGARSIPLGESFAGYVGITLPFNDELLLLLPGDEDWRRAQGQLIRIGYDRAVGYVAGGFAAWQRARLPVDRLTVFTIDELHRAHVDGGVVILDVRYDPEWRTGHIPHSEHLPIAMVPAHLGDVPQRDGKRLVTMCGSGLRATLAASLLKRVGLDPGVVAEGGYGDWASHHWPTVSGS